MNLEASLRTARCDLSQVYPKPSNTFVLDAFSTSSSSTASNESGFADTGSTGSFVNDDDDDIAPPDEMSGVVEEEEEQTASSTSVPFRTKKCKVTVDKFPAYRFDKKKKKVRVGSSAITEAIERKHYPTVQERRRNAGNAKATPNPLHQQVGLRHLAKPQDARGGERSKRRCTEETRGQLPTTNAMMVVAVDEDGDAVLE